VIRQDKLVLTVTKLEKTTDKREKFNEDLKKRVGKERGLHRCSKTRESERRSRKRRRIHKKSQNKGKENKSS